MAANPIFCDDGVGEWISGWISCWALCRRTRTAECLGLQISDFGVRLPTDAFRRGFRTLSCTVLSNNDGLNLKLFSGICIFAVGIVLTQLQLQWSISLFPKKAGHGLRRLCWSFHKCLLNFSLADDVDNFIEPEYWNIKDLRKDRKQCFIVYKKKGNRLWLPFFFNLFNPAIRFLFRYFSTSSFIGFTYYGIQQSNFPFHQEGFSKFQMTGACKNLLYTISLELSVGIFFANHLIDQPAIWTGICIITSYWNIFRHRKGEP